jgi:copper transport protein
VTRRPSRRRAGRAARSALPLLVLLVAFLVVVPAGPASAHAFLDHSTPSDGANEDQAPPDLQLQFSEPVVVAATRIEIADADGRHFQPGPVHLVAADTGAGKGGPVTLVADLPSLPRNAYRVSWETLSSDDLHRTSGVLVFGVAQQVAAGGFHESLPRPDEASLRWLVFLALALALGGAGCEGLFLRQPGVAAMAAATRCRRLSRGGAAAGLALAAVLLLDQLAAGHWAGRRLLISGYGQHWLLREGGLLLLLLAARRGRPTGPVRTAQLILGGVAACAGSALLGHAAGGPGLVVVHVLADAMHLAATAGWSGAVVVLAAVAGPLLRDRSGANETARAVLRSFAGPAAACVSVAVVTGVYLASAVVGSVDAVLMTFYGRTLLLKLVIAAAAGGLGLLSWARLRRGAETSRRALVAEAAGAASVLLLAAVLTSAQPAQEPQLVRTAGPATVRVVDGQAGDLQETLAIRPNRPGRNVVVLGVYDTRRPAPAPITGVSVTIPSLGGASTSPVPAERLADHQWSVPVALAASGPTQIRVAVQRAGFADATSAFSWTVGAVPAVMRPTAVSQAPIGRALKVAAVALAVVVLYAWLMAGYWRRSRRRRATLPAAYQPVEAPEYADAMAP